MTNLFIFSSHPRFVHLGVLAEFPSRVRICCSCCNKSYRMLIYDRLRLDEHDLSFGFEGFWVWTKWVVLELGFLFLVISLPKLKLFLLYINGLELEILGFDVGCYDLMISFYGLKKSEFVIAISLRLRVCLLKLMMDSCLGGWY